VVAYIQTLIKDLRNPLCDGSTDSGNDFIHRCVAVAEELNRLDPRDFPPDIQAEFVQLRVTIRNWADESRSNVGNVVQFTRTIPETIAIVTKQIDAGITPEVTANQIQAWKQNRQQLYTCLADNKREIDRWRAMLDRLIELLARFGGQGSYINRKEFPFISDKGLREIVERDYRSLVVELIPSEAWKSAVVMAGSILEAILYDQLTQNASQSARAMAHPDAPKKKGGAVKDITLDTREDEWSLSDLIKVCVGLNILPQARAVTIDQSVRDYRNFVHPRKELRAGHSCTEAETFLARGALDAVINHLSP
jgi:hypothetical protein